VDKDLGFFDGTTYGPSSLRRVAEPFVVEVRRNGVVEAVHRVHAVAVRNGAVVEEAGDAGLTCFMRSSSKPLQALPLVRARDDLTDADIAIACASHRGTPEQLQAARDLLAKANATEDDLELGLQEGRPPEKIYNNCSGKHAGMLALCDAHGWPKAGYHTAQHPVQRACAEAHAEAAHATTDELPRGNDGCGVVTFAMPLERMAFAFANLPQLPHARRITDAMRARPELVGGADGPDVLLMRRTETWVAKGGAEGLLCAVDLATNTGIALKAEDGAHRAIAPALAAFAHVHLPPSLVKNTRDEIVGDLSLRTTSA
jgi:L-asparaginase II